MKVLHILLLLTFILMSEPLMAYRCNRRLIEYDDFSSEVIQKCGDPNSLRSRYEYKIRTHDGYETVRVGDWAEEKLADPQIVFAQMNSDQEKIVIVEQWDYDLGKSKGIVEMTFEDSILKNIFKLGRKGFNRRD